MVSTHVLPRVVVAAPASGHGKTTVTSGLLAALRAHGLATAGFKVGPDYIDPGYHLLATGRPGRNLDPFLCPENLLVPLLLHGAATPDPADIAVIEGVMGLFDGRIGGDGYASTAHVARLLGAPVVLVLDGSALSRTAAAVVHGLATFEPGTRIAGVILNKTGSDRHAREITEALAATGVPVLGVLPRDAGIAAPSRHLGLVPAAERPEAAAALDLLAEQISERVDLTALLAIAHSAPPLVGEPWDPATALADAGCAIEDSTVEGSAVVCSAVGDSAIEGVVGPGTVITGPGGVITGVPGGAPVVAVAGGRAFSFCYPETLELLSAAGLRPVIFDPILDPALPEDVAGLYLGGGFPEVHARELAGNTGMIDSLRLAVASGVPTVAECAGLLYLCRALDGVPMVGAVDAEAIMTSRLTLGYRAAVADRDHLLAPAGRRVTGHEFHRTAVAPPASAQPAWLVDGHPVGFSLDPAGLGQPSVHASYLHLHWAGHPAVAARFAAAVHSYAADPAHTHRVSFSSPHQVVISEQNPGMGARAGASAGTGPGAEAPVAGPPGTASEAGPDLDHHGDRDVADGLVDLAVNVRLTEPPEWLAEVIRARVPDLAAYPDPSRARQAIAAAHEVDPTWVLPSAGGAELFTLLARARRWRAPVIVHPQFTEPEVALRSAGYTPRRVILTAAAGFRLDAESIPADADLVIIGNPTNPTGVLHPAATLRRLAVPGRLLVVDEAFLDAVPGEPETMIDPRMPPGVLVLRSLTKTWGLAGLRAGYAIGDPAMISDLAAQQPRWSVSTLAAAAMVACLAPEARSLAHAAAVRTAERREHLIAALAQVGLSVSPGPRTPFVLVDTAGWLPGDRPPGTVRQRLRDQGFAVRRGETFPGLGPDWIRLAVRDRATTDALASALRAIRNEAVTRR